MMVGSTVPAEHLDRVLELYGRLVTETRKEPGCVRYELLQRRDDPRELMLVEEWESQEHLDAHTRTPHFVTVVGELDRLERAAPALIYNRVL
ncbi:putative quinol monooxygenase [Rhodococcus kronopolitis]|uniref:Quinol monooxygenase n=1 Tax=Rhodococcus kronopolitis TaxID=1460226 RepID=A0ABV9FM66_9NOCA